MTTTTTTSISKLIRSASQYRAYVRAQTRAKSCRPIEVVDGDHAPKVAGDEWHYETRGGQVIAHPAAYSKSGWSNMVYCSSTRRVTVGREWLAARRIQEWAMTPTRNAKTLVRLGVFGAAGQSAHIIGMSPERIAEEIGVQETAAEARA